MVSATFSSPGCQHPRSGHHRSSHRPREAHPSLLRATPHLHISATPWQPASACCWTQSLLPGSWSRPSDPGPSGAPPPRWWPSSRHNCGPCPPAASPSPSSGASMACIATSRRIEHALSGAHASSSFPSTAPPFPARAPSAARASSTLWVSRLLRGRAVRIRADPRLLRRRHEQPLCGTPLQASHACASRRHNLGSLSLPMSTPSSVPRLSFKLFPSLAPSPPVWLNLAQAPAQLDSPCRPSSSSSPLLDSLLSLPS
jgi:hypothetical protein